MSQYLYLEGASGISGDMLVAALLDLGASRDKLDAVLKSLPVQEFDYEVAQKSSYSSSGCDFKVILHHQEHSHEEEYGEHHHKHHQEQRHLADVEEIIDKAEMSNKARNLANYFYCRVD